MTETGTMHRPGWFVDHQWAAHLRMYGDLEDRTLLLMIVQHQRNLEGYMTEFRDELSKLGEKLEPLLNRVESVVQVIRELPAADQITDGMARQLREWADLLEGDHQAVKAAVVDAPAADDPAPLDDEEATRTDGLPATTDGETEEPGEARSSEPESYGL